MFGVFAHGLSPALLPDRVPNRIGPSVRRGAVATRTSDVVSVSARSIPS